jgi:hypothetical protein
MHRRAGSTAEPVTGPALDNPMVQVATGMAPMGGFGW